MSPNRYYTPKHQYIRNLSRIKWDTSPVHNLRPTILWYKYTGYLFTEGNIRNVLYPTFAKEFNNMANHRQIFDPQPLHRYSPHIFYPFFPKA